MVVDYDNIPPVVSITHPVNWTTSNLDTIGVKGNAADDYELFFVSCNFSGHESWLYVDEDGRWSFAFGDLAASNYAVTVIPADMAGNTSSAFLNFTIYVP